jgi:hypothetical protein
VVLHWKWKSGRIAILGQFGLGEQQRFFLVGAGRSADAGLPVHRFALSDTAQAQLAVQRGATGKVLVDVAPPVLFGRRAAL